MLVSDGLMRSCRGATRTPSNGLTDVIRRRALVEFVEGNVAADSKSLGTAIDEIIAALEPLSDSARVTAIGAACDHLAIPYSNAADSRRAATAAATMDELPAAAASLPRGATDVRSLKEEKNPANAVEMAALLAYYLQRLAPASERKPQISAADVYKYFVQANFPLPKRSDQLLVNAKAAGYFDSATRGTYRLNPVGHNLIAHSLPRTGATSAKASRAKAKGSKAKKKASARTKTR